MRWFYPVKNMRRIYENGRETVLSYENDILKSKTSLSSDNFGGVEDFANEVGNLHESVGQILVACFPISDIPSSSMQYSLHQKHDRDGIAHRFVDEIDQ
nr:unnamed protein product [Callosobruchus chinensis]